MAERTGERRAPVAVLVAGVLGVLIAVGASLGGALTFTGPRWLPGQVATRRPAISTRPPVSIPSQTPKPPATVGHVPNLTWLVITLGAIAVALIAFIVIRWILRRRRDQAVASAGELQADALVEPLADDPSIETSMPYLRRGLARALDALESSRPPTDAIVEAWLGLQEAAEDAGFQRQIAETPTEFTSRILRQVAVDARSLAELRRLYLGVRFGDHIATAGDVDVARRALLELQEKWAVSS